MVVNACISLFISIHTCFYASLYKLLPDMHFSFLEFLSFPYSCSFPLPLQLFLNPAPHLCSLGSPAFLLEILPSSQSLSQSALMPWAVLASVGFSLQEGDRTSPFLVLFHQQKPNAAAKNRARSLKFIAQQVPQA